jgi:hypothetical protein
MLTILQIKLTSQEDWDVHTKWFAKPKVFDVELKVKELSTKVQ